MCSIEGTTNQLVDIKKFTRYNKSRGPDATHYWSDHWVQFGHNYLQISPNPERKTQPFVTPKGNVLLFNGEIYGLPEGTFDTEWLGNYLDEYGIGGLKYNVNGMWAIAWYEPNKQRVTLCRDHFGVKPLYWMQAGDDLYFSSTPRPLLAEIDNPTIDTFAKVVWDEGSRFSFGRRTIWNGINRCIPGDIVEYDLKNKRVSGTDTLWGNDSKRFNLHPNHLWDEEEMEELFIKAFNEVCHAPGIKKTISLSGGLDSTLIASLAKKQDNLSVSMVKYIGQPKNTDPGDWSNEADYFNEHELAMKTANMFNLPSHTIEIDEKLSTKHNDEVQWALTNIPHWDRNRTNPRYLNVMNASKNKNRIYICGDGADELLTGYNGHFNIADNKCYQTKEAIMHRAEKRMKYRVVRNEFPIHLFGLDPINNYLFTRALFELDSFCTVADSFTGAFGMESRMPFLHQELGKYLLKIPGAIKLDVPVKTACKRFKTREKRKEHKWWWMGHYKKLIREDMKKHIPAHIRNKEKKVGFAHPWNSRDHKLNNVIGDEDYLICVDQAKYLDKNVDFKPKLKDNVKQFETQ